VLCGAAAGQEGKSAAVFAVASEDEVVVVGRQNRLRREVEAAELAVLDRFNEINSDDRFDIHCRMQVRYFSHIYERVCRSNSWREQEKNGAQARLRALRGELVTVPDPFRFEQVVVEDLIDEELQRLAAEDPTLREAIARALKARTALADAMARGPVQTASREVAPDDGRLPFDAQRVFVVRVGRAPWSHPLTHRTFTIGQVAGQIRKLEVDCAQDRRRLDYQAGVDWTLPSESGACTLLLDAKPDTTFAFYEFE
jgi:hypothetical protein